MISKLYQKLTGQPWTTVRSASTEFGPPPGAVYREELSRYTDAELYAYGDVILSGLRARDRSKAQRRSIGVNA